jgi:hypothetical protein
LEIIAFNRQLTVQHRRQQQSQTKQILCIAILFGILTSMALASDDKRSGRIVGNQLIANGSNFETTNN